MGSTAIVILSWLGYGVGWYFSTLFLTRYINEVTGDWETDKGFHLTMSMFVCLLWPIVIVGILLYKHMLGKVPLATGELKEEIARLEKENQRLEREANE
jgi:Na+/proline symporter